VRSVVPSSISTRGASSKTVRCSRISGPLFDRIDLHVEVGAVNPMDLTLPPPAEGSRAIAAPDDAGRKLLAEAVERLKLSARGYHRMLRVARTLADLEGADGVRWPHVAEALSFRRVAPNRAMA